MIIYIQEHLNILNFAKWFGGTSVARYIADVGEGDDPIYGAQIFPSDFKK